MRCWGCWLSWRNKVNEGISQDDLFLVDHYEIVLLKIACDTLFQNLWMREDV